VRVSDGTRTRDRRDHNPELYQLSYAHQARQGQSTNAPTAASARWSGGRSARATAPARSGADRPAAGCPPADRLLESADYAFFVFFVVFFAFAVFAPATFRRTFSVFPAFSFKVDDFAITLLT
jgi:hypothetical protein